MARYDWMRDALRVWVQRNGWEVPTFGAAAAAAVTPDGAALSDAGVAASCVTSPDNGGIAVQIS